MAYLRPHSTFVAEQEVDLVSLQAVVSPSVHMLWFITAYSGPDSQP